MFSFYNLTKATSRSNIDLSGTGTTMSENAALLSPPLYPSDDSDNKVPEPTDHEIVSSNNNNDINNIDTVHTSTNTQSNSPNNDDIDTRSQISDYFDTTPAMARADNASVVSGLQSNLSNQPININNINTNFNAPLAPVTSISSISSSNVYNGGRSVGISQSPGYHSLPYRNTQDPNGPHTPREHSLPVQIVRVSRNSSNNHGYNINGNNGNNNNYNNREDARVAALIEHHRDRYVNGTPLSTSLTSIGSVGSVTSVGSFNRPKWVRTLTPLTPRGLAMYASQKFKPGSIKGAVVTVVISVVGAGILALPYGIREFGLIPGIVLLAFSACLSYFSLDLVLISVNHLPQGSHPSYRLLSQKSVGPILATIASITIMIQFFGSAVAYMVAAGGLFDLVWTVIGNKTHIYTYVIIILAICVIWPLSTLRDMSSLRHTALLGFLCSIYLGVVLFVEYFILCSDPTVRSSKYNDSINDIQFPTCFWNDEFTIRLYHLFPIKNGPIDILTGFLNSFPLFVFGFTCHQNMLPIYTELNRRSRRRMKKVLKRSLLISFTIYLFASVAAYLTFLEGTCSNILLNNFKQEIQVIIAAIAISISVTLTQPLFTFAFRMNLSMMIWNKKMIKSNIKHHIITFIFVALATIVSLTVTSIGTVFGLLGSTTYPLIGYILPAVFFCKLVPKDKYPKRRKLAILQALFVTISSLSSLAYQLYTLINNGSPSCSSVQTIVS